MKPIKIKMKTKNPVYHEDMSLAWESGQVFKITADKIKHDSNGEELYVIGEKENDNLKICVPANQVGILFDII